MNQQNKSICGLRILKVCAWAALSASVAWAAPPQVIKGRGIDPDVAVPTTAEILQSTDPVLDAALQWIRDGGS